MLERRELLRGAQLLAIGAFATPAIHRGAFAQVAATLPASPVPTPWIDPLPVPPVVSAVGDIGVLVAKSATHSFHSQLGPARTFGYGGASYLGPTLVAQRGQAVSYSASNQLGPHPLASSIDVNIHGAVASDVTARGNA